MLEVPMEKSLFKKCLQILDKIETTKFTTTSFYETFLTYANVEDLSLNKNEIFSLYKALDNSNNLEHYDQYFDLSQPLYIFARARHNSTLEALSLFEALIHEQTVLTRFETYLYDYLFLDKLDSFFVPIIKNSSLVEKIEGRYYFNHELLNDLRWIIQDVKNGLNCSDCLKTYYTRHLFTNTKLVFRNEEAGIIKYENLDKMLSLYKKVGIPEDRDSTKELQTFFKDCLFNEFKHSCSICGIDLPHMLIASHIKPFRDCGYLLEPMDANNGLLLCRNHDYLFDQGYISFDDEGNILITDEVLEKLEAYNVKKDYKLDKRHLTFSRKKFLEYHRNTYLKK